MKRQGKLLSPKKKKTWNKKKQIVVDIGQCKYCKKSMTNLDSFVAFYPKSQGKAHYDCMRLEDEKKHTKIITPIF
jgi:hypothetical protein